MPILNATANPGVASWSADGDGLVLGSGGNARGTAAVDLQTTRAAATQVASGDYSGILWGSNNTASGNSAAAGGVGSTASGTYSIALGNGASATGQDSVAIGLGASAAYDNALCIGNGNANETYTITLGGAAPTAGSPYAIAIGSNNNAGALGGAPYTISIGYGPNASAAYAIAIGYSNPRALAAGAIAISTASGDASGAYSVCIGGDINATADYAAVIGGNDSDATATHAFVAAGASALGDHPGTVAFSANSLGGPGEAGKSQGQLVHLDGVTVGAAAANLTSIATELAIPANGLFEVTGRVAAWNETDEKGSKWDIDVLVYNTGAALVIVSQLPIAGAQPAVATDDGAHTLTVAASGTDLRFTGTGVVVGKTVRWAAVLTVVRATT